MALSDRMLELAATAIMNRRIQPDFYGVDKNNFCLYDTDKELAKAALTAALSDQVVDWQPIETAPKDGTDVLVVNAGASTPAATVAHFWNEKCWVCCHSEDYTDTLHGEIGIMGFPTHWQPLPEPPPVPASHAGTVIIERRD